jgi:carboxyl-terminal processing protease
MSVKNVPTKYREYRRSMVMGALTGLGLAIAFMFGFVARDFAGDLAPALANNSSSEVESYPLLDEVQQLIDQHYLREQPDYTQRQYGAIRGMLSSLEDRFTFFIEPPVAQSESDVLAGTYGGIGVQLQRAESGEFVLFPFPDGPAAKAGIEDGDVLKEVNGMTVDLSQQQDVVDQMLRGEVAEGSGVELTVLKAQTEEEFTTFILFDVINVPSVVWRVLAEDEQIGYIQILRFTSRTPEELATAITELRGSEIESLVLDLRNNSGGLLQESVQVAGQFLEGGVIVYEKTNNDEEAFTAESGGLATDIPMVILVNQGTASAAELVAGAIRDRGRGIMIGQTTYGKGTVQQIFTLSDKSSIHITSAEWFTPSRNELDGLGLKPDIEMIPDENGRDIELGEAIRYLQQEQVAAQEES